MKQGKYQKVAVVGIGNVGSAVAYGMVNQGLCNKLVLINRNKDKALGLALDLRESMEYMERNMSIWAGDVTDCGDADIVFICMGGHVTANRMETLNSSCQMVKPYVEGIMAAGFEGHFIVLTNPVDVVAHYIYKLSGLPASHVIGTGTALDSARLKCLLSERTGIASRSILALCMGEHGNSMMIPWSKCFISGKSIPQILEEERSKHPEKHTDYASDAEHLVEKVKKAGWKINNLMGYTCYGVASSALGIARHILRDENYIIPCSVYLDGPYGVHDVFASVPVVLGADGVVEIFELPLTPEELEQFQSSAKALKEAFLLVE